MREVCTLFGCLAGGVVSRYHIHVGIITIAHCESIPKPVLVPCVPLIL